VLAVANCAKTPTPDASALDTLVVADVLDTPTHIEVTTAVVRIIPVAVGAFALNDVETDKILVTAVAACITSPSDSSIGRVLVIAVVNGEVTLKDVLTAVILVSAVTDEANTFNTGTVADPIPVAATTFETRISSEVVTEVMLVVAITAGARTLNTGMVAPNTLVVALTQDAYARSPLTDVPIVNVSAVATGADPPSPSVPVAIKILVSADTVETN
jgi:hypothetical protein